MERYVIDDERDKTTDEAEVYDPQTDSLEHGSSFPERTNHSATAAYNSK